MAGLMEKDGNEEKLCRIWMSCEASGEVASELVRIWDDSALIKAIIND